MRSISITSRSGGVGVTSIALHLALELATRGSRTCVVDPQDSGGVRARLLLDPTAPERAPIPVAGGFSVATNPDPGPGFDRVVFDGPGGEDAYTILVSAPSPVGALRALPAVSGARMVVINRVGPGGETTRAALASLLDVVVSELPVCASLRDAEDLGRLLTRGWTRWSRAIGRLADEVER